MIGIKFYHIMEVHLFPQFAKRFFFSLIAVEYYKILLLDQLR